MRHLVDTVFIGNTHSSFHLLWKENFQNIEKSQNIMKLIADFTKQKKNSCSIYQSFNVLFSITTYNFLTTDSKLLPQQLFSIFAYLLVFTCSLHSYALHLQSYRTPTETMSRKCRKRSVNEQFHHIKLGYLSSHVIGVIYTYYVTE